jgi:hypothetical protein
MESFWSLLSTTANEVASQYATPQSIRCRIKSKTQNQERNYFTAIAPTRDSKILKPSVPPNSGSLERSG